MEELKPCPYSLSGEYRKALSMAISALQAQDLQPNLQQTCNQLATDTISRQAAIDAVETKIKKWNAVDGEGYHVGLGLRYTDVIDTLTELPSAQPDLSDFCDRLWKAAYERGKAEAQPDIIHCGECKHRDPEDHKCDCGHDILWQLPRDDEWYCADAERKEGGGDADTEV